MGQDATHITVHAMKFNSAKKYAQTFASSLEPLIVSETVFQQQTPEMQKISSEAGQEDRRASRTRKYIEKN